MIIIVGLGNPGEKFKYTRHNAGFEALDFFAEKNNFPEFTLSKKYNALTSEKDDVILVKPQTFMNESGLSVAGIMKNKEATLIVVHDDVDVQIGKLKISKDSGAGGHKGIASIIQHLGTKDFARIKIGICPILGKPDRIETFVIQKFMPAEKELLDSVIAKTTEALDLLISKGLEKAMNEFNQ